MNITMARAKDFENMMARIAKRHGCSIEVVTNNPDYTDVGIEYYLKRKEYRVVWSEASSLTDAAVDIWADWFANKPNSINYAAFANYCKNDLEATREIAHVQSHSIKDVIFNDPATIVFWHDGTKTVVKCGVDDIYDPEKGLAMAIAKKFLGNQGNYFNEFKKWIKPKPTKEDLEKVYLDEAFERIRKNIERITNDALLGDKGVSKDEG